MKLHTVVIVLAMLALSACDSDDGAAERMGAAIDEAASNTADTLREACEEARDAVGAADRNC